MLVLVMGSCKIWSIAVVHVKMYTLVAEDSGGFERSLLHKIVPNGRLVAQQTLEAGEQARIQILKND